MRVRFIKPITFNLTGYDREPVEFEAGEHEIAAPYAARVSTWLAANPGAGSVIDDGTAAAVASHDSDGATTPSAPSESNATDDLDNRSAAELRELAKAAGVPRANTATRAALIEALRAIDQDGDTETTEDEE